MERKDKALWTDKGEGEQIHFRQFDTAYEEAECMAGEIGKKKKYGKAEYKDCAVLYRTNAQSRMLEMCIRDRYRHLRRKPPGCCR